MSHVKILVHCVWSTKERYPFLSAPQHRQALFAHIVANAREKGIYLLNIGGHNDHVHVLLSLGAKQEIAKVVQMLKGESARWFNASGRGLLQWQDDYFAVSVGPDTAGAVAKYIAEQEQHHAYQPQNVDEAFKHTFEYELGLLQKRLG